MRSPVGREPMLSGYAGPAPIMVPGLGLGAESWQPTLAALGVGADAVRLLPGYGRPVGATDPTDPAGLAALLVEALPSGPVVLCGHSASCQVVVEAARRAPLRVAAVVLVGPTTDPRARTWPRLAARWLRTAVHEDPRQLPALVRQYRRTTLRSMRRVMGAARHQHVGVVLRGVAVPVVLVRGHRDRICPRAWLDWLADQPIGPATAVTLPSGAHMVPFTDPGPLASQVERLLRTVSGGGLDGQDDR